MTMTIKYLNKGKGQVRGGGGKRWKDEKKIVFHHIYFQGQLMFSTNIKPTEECRTRYGTIILTY